MCSPTCDTEKEEWLLKFSFAMTGINYILQYIKIESVIVVIFHNINSFYCI